MNFKLVKSTSGIEEYLKGHNLMGLDIETSPFDKYRKDEKAALDSNKSKIVGISISVESGTGIYIPLCHRDYKNANFDAVWTYVKEHILLDNSKTVVIHNAAFESAFFYALGVVMKCKVYDTMAAAQLTLKTKTEFRKLSDSGLKKLVPELLKENLPTFGEVVSQANKPNISKNSVCDVGAGSACFDELSPDNSETVRYVCSDSDYALRLYHLFNKWFDENLSKHRFIVEEIESPTAVYVGLMKHNGLLVDIDLLKEKQSKALDIIRQLKEDISLLTGNVNVGSNATTKEFKHFLFNKLKLPVLKTTQKNKEAADDEAFILLSSYCKEHEPEYAPLFEIIKEYRKWGKIKSTYIDSYLKYLNPATGRIHPDLFPLGTETGRFASRYPNLQNCPRKDNDPIGVRNFFIAPKGKILMSLDFSQIELRVGAFYCRDEAMMETYKSGGDIHAKTTSVIYKIPFEQAVDKNAPHYKERRTIAKACNFGVFFGLFPNGLLRSLKFKAGLNVTLDECTEIIKNLKAGYPQLEIWQRKVKVKAKFNEYTETYLGRRRYLPNIISQEWNKKSFAERQALNTPIQGTAADILKLAIVRILCGLPERPWLRPLLQIHDELMFELPEEKLTETVDFVRKCMETKPFKDFDLPLVAEAAVGTRFGSLKEMEGGQRASVAESPQTIALRCFQLDYLKNKIYEKEGK